MDQKRIQQQAQNLRSKQLARQSNPNPPSVNSGVVKFNKPIPPQSSEVNINPPTAAQIRMLRAQRLLEQRKSILARRMVKQDQPSTGVSEMAANTKKNKSAKQVPPPKKKKGCSSCRRGK